MTQSERPTSLARRLVPAAMLGGASVLFVMALDRPAATEDLATGDIDEELGAPSATTDPSVTSPSTTTPSTGSQNRRSTPSTTTPATPSTTVPATPTCSGDERTGPSVSTKFGPVQVAATIADDGTICAVDTVVWPDDDRKSRSINQRALPTLEQRAVQAQSAQINAVSGATVTSRAFVQSLQALLDG